MKETIYKHLSMVMKEFTAELQWRAHLKNVFETGEVRANEC